MTAKKRLDVLLVERGLAASRTQAQALVLAGRVKGHAKAGEQVDETARNFAIYKERVEDPSAPDAYTMGHTSSILLFDPEGDFVRIFEYTASPEGIARDLEERVKA